MSKTTTLASGKVTPTDKLLVELLEPEEFPASIVITWPQAPSAVDPRKFDATSWLRPSRSWRTSAPTTPNLACRSCYVVTQARAVLSSSTWTHPRRDTCRCP